MNRYRNYNLITNDLTFYKKQLKRRDKKTIVQVRPRPLGTLSDEVRRRIIEIKVSWSVDTKLYKLANEYYGDQDLWWVIGYYNNKPTDADWNVGDEVAIPTPISLILESLNL